METSKKRSISLRNLSNSTLRQERKGQMIVLMGITLALSVLIMGSLAAEISDINVAIPQIHTSDLLSEYIHIREAFGLALNYNLADITVDVDDSFIFEGEIYPVGESFPDISEVVDQTSNSFRDMLLQHDRYFRASYEGLDYTQHLSSEEGHVAGDVYFIKVYLFFEDSQSVITETVRYSIVCKEPIL